MYNGEVNVSQEDLNSFLAVAEDLKVKGLTQNAGGVESNAANHSSVTTDSNISRTVSTTATTPSSTNRTKTSLQPSAVNSRNGGSLPPAAKRFKRDPGLIKVKDEAGLNQQVVVTPDVSFEGGDDGAEIEEEDRGDEDGPVYEEEGEVYPYGAYESEGGDSLVDPLTMAVAGTSGVDGSKDVSEDEDWKLTSNQIKKFLSDREVLFEPGAGFKCPICSKVQRDQYDIKKHYLTHLLNPKSELSVDGLVQRVDDYVSLHSIENSSKSYTCHLCKKSLSVRYSSLRHHFILKHLEASSDQEQTD